MATVKALVIETDSFFREYLEKFLSLSGCEVSFARDGAEGLAYAHADEFMLVSANAAVLALDPASFVQSIKASRPWCKILLVNLAPENQEPCRQSGANAVLGTGFRIEEFAEKIKSLLPIQSGEKVKENARLLIVEDEEELCDFIAEYFASRGFETYRAYNGKGAMDLMRKYRCNLAIVDLKLPQIRGEELIANWKAGETSLKEMYVITSALEESIDGLRRKGLRVFPKPINMDELEEALMEACKRHGLVFKTEAGK